MIECFMTCHSIKADYNEAKSETKYRCNVPDELELLNFSRSLGY